MYVSNIARRSHSSCALLHTAPPCDSIPADLLPFLAPLYASLDLSFLLCFLLSFARAISSPYPCVALPSLSLSPLMPRILTAWHATISPVAFFIFLS